MYCCYDNNNEDVTDAGNVYILEVACNNHYVMVSNVYSTLGITSQYSAIFIFRSHNFTWKFQNVHSSILFSSSFFLAYFMRMTKEEKFPSCYPGHPLWSFQNFPNIKVFSYFTLLTSLYHWSVLESCIRLILFKM